MFTVSFISLKTIFFAQSLLLIFRWKFYFVYFFISIRTYLFNQLFYFIKLTDLSFELIHYFYIIDIDLLTEFIIFELLKSLFIITNAFIKYLLIEFIFFFCDIFFDNDNIADFR